MVQPAAPTARQERFLVALMRRGLGRGLYAKPQDPAPPEWDARPFGIPRTGGGLLAALLFDEPAPRGVIVFGHPSIPPAKGYFHRSDRIPFARSLGFACVTWDYGGFGESDPPTSSYHREWLDVLSWATRRFPGTPLHVWGVSLGGYFAHHALAQGPEVESAVFEHVSPNLPEYGGASFPLMRVGARGMRLVAPETVRWFAAEAHAPSMRADRVLYLSGGRDHGITRAQADRLARAAGPLARHVTVDDAAHLEAWKKGREMTREAVRATLAPRPA